MLRRWKLLEDGGVTFHLGAGIGEGVDFNDLRARHDALLIATGVYKARDIGGPGAGLPGIVPALEFLTASNRQGLGDDVPAFDSGALNAAGKRVVVIGGGDTAMDCVRTARAPGGRICAVPIPPRPGQHARLHARGEERAGRGRRVRLAVRARGVPGRHGGDGGGGWRKCGSACPTRPAGSRWNRVRST